MALLAVLLVVVLLYVSPVSHWISQSRTADAQGQELSELKRENAELKARARSLRRPYALEHEARELGMVRVGERAFAVEDLPAR